jgi:hypothetical protein
MNNQIAVDQHAASHYYCNCQNPPAAGLTLLAESRQGHMNLRSRHPRHQIRSITPLVKVRVLQIKNSAANSQKQQSIGCELPLLQTFAENHHCCGYSIAGTKIVAIHMLQVTIATTCHDSPTVNHTWQAADKFAGNYHCCS